LPPISSWECSTRWYVPNFTMVEPESRRKPALMGGKRASKTEPEQFASYLVREYSKSYMFQLQCGGTRNILASRSHTCVPSRILGIPKIVCLSSCQGNMQWVPCWREEISYELARRLVYQIWKYLRIVSLSS
jgi:exopolysaccharide biosynthesis predicted pyruvyltransferase EpsI